MRKVFQHHAFLHFFKFLFDLEDFQKGKLSRKANAEAASELSIEELEKSNLIDEPCLKDGQNFFIFVQLGDHKTIFVCQFSPTTVTSPIHLTNHFFLFK